MKDIHIENHSPVIHIKESGIEVKEKRAHLFKGVMALPLLFPKLCQLLHETEVV